MGVLTYHTSGGKDLILEYIDSLSKGESAVGYAILDRLAKDGFDALQYMDTRLIKGKLWEIKFRRQNRIFLCYSGRQKCLSSSCLQETEGKGRII